jgi:hypothetical protein
MAATAEKMDLRGGDTSASAEVRLSCSRLATAASIYRGHALVGRGDAGSALRPLGRSVLVPMTFVGRVSMTIMQVVEMVAVLNRGVSAVRSVLVSVILVDDVCLEHALIPVLGVTTVDVPIVEIVDVIAVGDGDVSAPLAVNVRMVLMGPMLGAHGATIPHRLQECAILK